MCGKNNSVTGTINFNVGSPPRVREKPEAIICTNFGYGITPASAGKTRQKSPYTLPSWDHPRECGKNYPIPVSVDSVCGSPPRVREKRWHARKAVDCRGITPASAGKTGQKAHWNWIYKDHPRECGKNVKTCKISSLVAGSPPRVREKLAIAKVDLFKIGITPASAGKTLNQPSSCLFNWDHPRECGKN